MACPGPQIPIPPSLYLGIPSSCSTPFITSILPLTIPHHRWGNVTQSLPRPSEEKNPPTKRRLFHTDAFIWRTAHFPPSTLLFLSSLAALALSVIGGRGPLPIRMCPPLDKGWEASLTNKCTKDFGAVRFHPQPMLLLSSPAVCDNTYWQRSRLGITYKLEVNHQFIGMPVY